MQLSLTVFLATLTALLLEKGNGNATVLVYLSHYYNPGGLKSNRECCDGYWGYSCNPCDHYFKVCLDKASDSRADNRCQYKVYTTGVTVDQNNITFSNTIGRTKNPQVIHFPRWPGSVLLKVRVWDDDDYRDDFVEQLTATVTMNASWSRAEKRYESFTVQKRTQLDFHMAVFCDENWYGPYCDIYCEPYRKSYRCRHSREKVCHPGQTCYINECALNPCLNEGTCEDKIGEFQCLCPLGFTGPTCETDVDECASNPCDNNATCLNVIGHFWCLCPSGYTGLTCENQIDECASSPCDSNATCVDRIDHFLCLCPNGYTGPTCMVDIDECDSNPCQNHATCINHVGQFQCLCTIGYTGSMCGIQADASSCTSCDNDGTGSQASQTAKVAGIIVAVVLVIVVAIVVLLIIWKINQKRQTQQNEQQNGDYGLSHEEATVYYIAEPVQQQHLREENIYQNSTAVDTLSTDTVLYGNSVYGTGQDNVYGNASVIHLHETQTDP